MSFLVLLAFVSSLFAALPKAMDLSIAPTTPAANIVLGSSAGVTVAVIRLAELRHSATTVTKLTVMNCLVVEELLFTVNSTDNAASGWNSLANFGQDAKWALYDLADMSTQIEIDIYFFGTTDLEYVLIHLEEEIAAGQTSTYALYADTTGASAADNDVISIDIPNEAEADLLGLDTIYWSDDSTGAYYDGEFIKTLPLYGGTITY